VVKINALLREKIPAEVRTKVTQVFSMLRTSFMNVRVQRIGQYIASNKFLWRTLLLLAIVYHLGEAAIRISPFTKTAQSPEQIALQTEHGMGGAGLFDGEGEYVVAAMAGFHPDHAHHAEDAFSEIEVAALLDTPAAPEDVSQVLTFSFYSLESGDIIGTIAANSGLVEDTLISVNNIRNTRLLQIGQVIRIPNQDGVYHTVKAGETLETLAETHKTTSNRIRAANELFDDTLIVNTSLFIPGGRLDWVNRQEINGDLFIWPSAGHISSPYGYRRSPFTGERSFHSGLDIAAPIGTPVRAAMSGRVAQVGYSEIFGNFVVLNHHSGYRTLYAHLHTVRTRTGANVATGERIGDMGNSGLTTGSHLHFTVYRNGATVNPRTLMRR